MDCERDIVHERAVEERRQLLDHVCWQFMPPVSFFREMENGIALAAAGGTDEMLEFDGRRYRVGEFIEHYDLSEFVDRATLSDDDYKERFLAPDSDWGEMPF